MEKKFEYRGDLAVTPLAEILSTIHRYRVPGVVTASREGRVRRIYLDDGLVVFAASNEREMSLSAYLVRDRKSTRLNSSHRALSRMPSSA